MPSLWKLAPKQHGLLRAHSDVRHFGGAEAAAERIEEGVLAQEVKSR